MNKIIRDTEAQLLVALLISTYIIYDLKDSIIWLIILFIWITNLVLRLSYISNKDVGGDANE
jgi:hypothetical protein